MVAGGETLEATNLEENTTEVFDNTTEDDDDPSDASEDVNEDEEAGDEEGDSESDEDDDDDDEEEEEEDPDDPQDTLREKCQDLPKCVALQEEFDICQDRVNGRQNTEENCSQELLEFIGCVDKCVSKSLFSHLK